MIFISICASSSGFDCPFLLMVSSQFARSRSEIKTGQTKPIEKPQSKKLVWFGFSELVVWFGFCFLKKIDDGLVLVFC